MYNYSPIKELKIRNFRNLGDIEIDFTESPIISLVGENESGKTSVVKAFGVCAAHQSPRSQKDYIRDGTNGFGVAIELEDGTLITRMKTNTANVYRVQKADGTVWEAQKLESTVPKAVSDVMGLIEEKETKELLQIRTYEDQLLFVITPASTNYRVMYDALKISQITRAIKVGNTEANEIKAKINVDEHSIETLESSLRKMRTFDLGPAINIKNKLIKDLDTLNKLDSAYRLILEIRSKRDQLGSIGKLFDSNIQSIDELTVSKINEAARALEEHREMIGKRELYASMLDQKEIDIHTLSNLQTAYERKSDLAYTKNRSLAYTELYNASNIDESSIILFSRVESILKGLKLYNHNLSILDISNAKTIGDTDINAIGHIINGIDMKNKIIEYRSYEKQLNNYIDQVINWLKSIGVATTDCPNCGESVIIDLDLLVDKD